MIINNNDVKVLGRVVATTVEGKVASAEQVFDDTYKGGTFQSTINSEMSSQLQTVDTHLSDIDTHLQDVDTHLSTLDDNTIEKVTANMYSHPNTDPTVQVVYGEGTLHFNFDGLQGDAASIKVGTTTTGEAGSQAKVINSGTQEDAIFNFTIPRGDKGTKGEKGDGWTIKGFVDQDSDLPGTAELGDTYLVGTTTPYYVYMYKGTQFVNVGTATEIKGSVIDGGRADTKYGGTRTIDCGGADAFLTV